MASQWWSGPQYIAVGIYRRKSSTIAVMPSRDERLHSSWASACDTPSDVLILHLVWFYDSEPYYLGFRGQSSFNKCENMAHFFCKSLIADQPLCWAWSCATLLASKSRLSLSLQKPGFKRRLFAKYQSNDLFTWGMLRRRFHTSLTYAKVHLGLHFSPRKVCTSNLTSWSFDGPSASCCTRFVIAAVGLVACALDF